MADLDAASMKDVQEWFKTYYGPSNVVMVIAGDIDVKTAREKGEKYFGDIPAGPPVAHQEVWIAKMTGTHRQWCRTGCRRREFTRCGTFRNMAAPMPTISTW
jgi:predicted Zn-dependent peptidase